MIDNMLWAKERAAGELQHLYEQAKAEGDVKAMVWAYGRLEALRDKLQDYAEGAAKYVHAVPKQKEEEPPAEPLTLINPFANDQAEIFKRFGGQIRGNGKVQ